MNEDAGVDAGAEEDEDEAEAEVAFRFARIAALSSRPPSSPSMRWLASASK